MFATEKARGMEIGTKYDQQFMENTVRYYLDHPELTFKKVSANRGISDYVLKMWLRAVKGILHSPIEVMKKRRRTSEEFRFRKSLDSAGSSPFCVTGVENQY